MKRAIKALALAMVLLLCGWAGSGFSQSMSANSLFASVISQIEQSSQVPVRLPSTVPVEEPIYAVLNEVNAQHYLITLGLAPDCDGGNWCSVGSVRGEALTSASPNLEAIAQENGPYEERQPQWVTLSNGGRAYYIPAVCGLNCSNALIYWEESGYRYSIGLKAGQLDALLQIANSAVQAEE